MAWMWWLLAPMASTIGGASLLCWRGSREVGSPGRARDAMREHRALLSALARLAADQPLPVTMRVLDPVSTD